MLLHIPCTPHFHDTPSRKQELEIESKQAVNTTTGRTYACPPSRLPQGRSKHQARRRALGRRDTAIGCFGWVARGEESQAEQVVSAQGDQLALGVLKGCGRAWSGCMDVATCVYHESSE